VPEIDLGPLLDMFASDCRWHRSPGERGSGKYDKECGASFCDLSRPVPPDVSPAMRQLKVVHGGKFLNYLQGMRASPAQRAA
jgi:hypothetical protein